MSVGFERFIACFIMDLQDFTGLNQYIVIPGVTEKYSRQTKSEATPSEEWIIFKLIF